MKNVLANFFRKYNFARQMYRVIKGIDFSFSVPQIAPIRVTKSRFRFKRINLVIPSINREHYFGGVSTALSLFHSLADYADGNIRTRILLTDAVPREEDLNAFSEYRLTSHEHDSDGKKQIIPVVNKYQRDIFVSPWDRFLSTSWWTAYCTILVVKQQSAEFGEPCNRMGYLIQDFEPGFYNWSTHYVLAESTYRSDVLTYPIFNSYCLKDYFSKKGYQFEQQFVFEPRLNPKLGEYLNPESMAPRDKKILIYGRPSVDRNCFTLIVEALRIWARLEADVNEWEVISVGESHKPIALGNGKVMKSLGKLTLDAYAQLLSRSAIGLSFMVSPHPSYPPLEMAHFGLLTITNAFENKNLSQCHENISSIGCLTPGRIADALSSCIIRFSKDPLIGVQGKSLISNYCQSRDMFPFVPTLYTLLFPED